MTLLDTYLIVTLALIIVWLLIGAARRWDRGELSFGELALGALTWASWPFLLFGLALFLALVPAILIIGPWYRRRLERQNERAIQRARAAIEGLAKMAAARADAGEGRE